MQHAPCPRKPKTVQECQQPRRGLGGGRGAEEGHAPKASHQRPDVLPLLRRTVEAADQRWPGKPDKSREHGRGALDDLDDGPCTLCDARVGAVDEEDL